MFDLWVLSPLFWMGADNVCREDNAYSYFHNQRLRSASSDPNHEKNDQRPITVSRTVEEDRQNEKVVHGMKLLLAARERVLSLSEQRVRLPQEK